MRIGKNKCADCGSPDLFAVAPGQDMIRTALLMLRAGRPDQVWCEPCWMKRFGAKPPRERKPVAKSAKR